MKIRIKRLKKRIEVLALRAEIEKKTGDITKYIKTLKYMMTLEAKLETLI